MKPAFKIFSQPLTTSNLPSTQLCQHCKLFSHTKPTNKWVTRCERCDSLQMWFVPTPFQHDAFNNPYQTTVMMTSYGSGKTTANAYFFAMHLRTINQALVISCAQTTDQLKKIIQKELDNFFLDDEFIVKNKEEWTLQNGSTILFVSSKNDEAIRSGNATGIWMIEASGIPQAWFKEGTARVRNAKAFVFDPVTKTTINKTKIMIETNPTFGWVKDLVLSADQITFTPKVKNKQLLIAQAHNKQQNISAYLATIEDNPYLPIQFVQNVKKVRTPSEIDLDLYLDLTQAHALVYESVVQNRERISQAIDPYSANPNQVFVESLDIGGSNDDNHPTAYILGKFDTVTKTLYILEAWLNKGTIVAQDCERINQTRNHFNFNKDRSLFFTADSVVVRSDKRDRSSLKIQYEQRLSTPIDVKKVKVGGIKGGVELTKAWFNQNRIVINKSNTQDLWDNLCDYKVVNETKFDKLLQANITTTKYTGQNDLCDALKYLIVKLNHYYPLDQHNLNLTQALNQPLAIKLPPSTTPTDLWSEQVQTKALHTINPKNEDYDDFW